MRDKSKTDKEQGRWAERLMLKARAALGSKKAKRTQAAWLRAADIGLPRHVVKAAAEKAVAAAEAKRERRRATRIAEGR